MAKRNPATFFMLTWLPYLVASVGLTGWVGFIDMEAVLFAFAAATSLAGLLTLVHEVDYPALATRDAEALVRPATA
ncbi:MAG: hypothetical protein FJZ01_17820 [Candidatus Sericytochromatia bacterium]|nr:hypothetical protein [Candidatus Tanganyikabacteria bacterium]